MYTKIFIPFLVIMTFLNAVAEEIVFEGDVQYKKDQQDNFIDLKSGETVEINRGESIFVVTNQNIPLVIFSATNSDSQIKVSDSNLATSVLKLIEPHIDKATNEIVNKLRAAEAMIQKRDYSQASQIILGLKQQYANNSSIYFMSASVRYLLNDRNAAIDDLQKGLAINPNDENAKKLLAKLKGGL